MAVRLRLKSASDGTIHPSEMQDGDVGVVERCGVEAYVGRLVHLSDVGNIRRLLAIGRLRSETWDSCDHLPTDFRVRLLQPGDVIDVVED